MRSGSKGTTTGSYRQETDETDGPLEVIDLPTRNQSSIIDYRPGTCSYPAPIDSGAHCGGLH